MVVSRLAGVVDRRNCYLLRCRSQLLALPGGSLRRRKWSGIESLSDDLHASSAPPPVTPAFQSYRDARRADR
jgi:hypothetical protein